MTPALSAACVRAIHVVTADGRVLRAGRASLFILEQIGYQRLARLFSRPSLFWAAELGYWLVANHRPFIGRFLFRHEQPLPSRYRHDGADS